MSIEKEQLSRILEGALLAAGHPLSVARLQDLFTEEEKPEKEELQAVLEDIQADCEGRGFELKEVGSGWRFQVCKETAPWVNRLWDEKPQKYSRALLETVALIAYRQPITRGDIEEIRGVAVSSHIIKTLIEREWVKAVGHRDVPGRPALYATTRQFLDYFNLKSLEELPTLSEISDLEKLNPELELAIVAASPTADNSEAADNRQTATPMAALETAPESEATSVVDATVSADTVAEDTLVEETLVEETLVEETLVEETLVEETLVEETLPDDILAEEPASNVSTGNVSTGNAS